MSLPNSPGGDPGLPFFPGDSKQLSPGAPFPLSCTWGLRCLFSRRILISIQSLTSLCPPRTRGLFTPHPPTLLCPSRSRHGSESREMEGGSSLLSLFPADANILCGSNQRLKKAKPWPFADGFLERNTRLCFPTHPAMESR